MGAIIAKSYHHGQGAGGGGGGVRVRGGQRRQISEDSISPKKIRGLDDLMQRCKKRQIWQIQGGFFNCSHPKVSKYKKKPKYTNCSHGNSSEMSKYGKSQNIVTVPHC